MSTTPLTSTLGAATDTRSERRRLSPTLWIGATLVGLVILVAVISFFWTPYDPVAVDAPSRLMGPSGAHWLGTDALGRDVFSQMEFGARTTMFVGVIAVGVGAIGGIPLGVVAGMSGRFVSEPILRLIDILLAFPALLLAILFGAVWGASTLTAMLAIGIATAPGFARLSRAGTLQVMSTEYVLAARVAGKGKWVIAVRHVLPNVSGLLIVQASVSYGIAVLAEAALSYLGFGTPPPTPSWGRILLEAQTLLFTDPLLSLWPAAAIALAVLGFNLLGDGLRDRFDPQLDDRR
jgi:peptide/nickel transport system permease protein